MPELVDYVEGFMVLNQHAYHSSSVAFPAPVNFSPDFGSGGGKACSVGWFVSLLVRKEVLLVGLCERKIMFRLKIYDRL